MFHISHALVSHNTAGRKKGNEDMTICFAGYMLEDSGDSGTDQQPYCSFVMHVALGV
jgi:hypothetical protein